MVLPLSTSLCPARLPSRGLRRPDTGRYLVRDLFRYQQQGVRDGKAFGSYFATGKRPKCLQRLHAAGMHLPDEMFSKRILATRSEFDQPQWKNRLHVEQAMKGAV